MGRTDHFGGQFSIFFTKKCRSEERRRNLPVILLLYKGNRTVKRADSLTAVY